MFFFFNALTFARSRGRCWKQRPSASVFDTSHETWRILMHENPCLIPIFRIIREYDLVLLRWIRVGALAPESASCPISTTEHHLTLPQLFCSRLGTFSAYSNFLHTLRVQYCRNIHKRYMCTRPASVHFYFSFLCLPDRNRHFKEKKKWGCSWWRNKRPTATARSPDWHSHRRDADVMQHFSNPIIATNEKKNHHLNSFKFWRRIYGSDSQWSVIIWINYQSHFNNRINVKFGGNWLGGFWRIMFFFFLVFFFFHVNSTVAGKYN